MKVLACYSVWNEDERIGASMRSVLPVVTHYVIVDGRYEGFFPNRSVHSTDLTVQMINRFPNVKLIQTHKALRPVEKRNIYLKEDADWYLMMDADEILYGDLKRLKHELDMGKLHSPCNIAHFTSLKDLSIRKVHYYCTLFPKGCGFHYAGYHWVRKDKHDLIIDSHGVTLDYVWILALNELIPAERLQQKTVWNAWRSDKGEGW